MRLQELAQSSGCSHKVRLPARTASLSEHPVKIRSISIYMNIYFHGVVFFLLCTSFFVKTNFFIYIIPYHRYGMMTPVQAPGRLRTSPPGLVGIVAATATRSELSAWRYAVADDRPIIVCAGAALEAGAPANEGETLEGVAGLAHLVELRLPRGAGGTEELEVELLRVRDPHLVDDLHDATQEPPVGLLLRPEIHLVVKRGPHAEEEVLLEVAVDRGPGREERVVAVDHGAPALHPELTEFARVEGGRERGHDERADVAGDPDRHPQRPPARLVGGGGGRRGGVGDRLDHLVGLLLAGRERLQQIVLPLEKHRELAQAVVERGGLVLHLDALVVRAAVLVLEAVAGLGLLRAVVRRVEDTVVVGVQVDRRRGRDDRGGGDGLVQPALVVRRLVEPVLHAIGRVVHDLDLVGGRLVAAPGAALLVRLRRRRLDAGDRHDREDGREHELAELAHDSVAFRLRHASTAGNGGRTAGNVRAPSNFV